MLGLTGATLIFPVVARPSPRPAMSLFGLGKASAFPEEAWTSFGHLRIRDIADAASERPTLIQSPDWVADAQATLLDMLELERGWDGERASPLTWPSALDAMSFLRRVMKPGVSLPSFVPLPSGGIQLEWHEGGLDIEARFSSSEYWVYIADLRRDTEWEGSQSEGIARLLSIARRLGGAAHDQTIDV
jgi:hypothetical protein